jgi:hypothetical protein
MMKPHLSGRNSIWQRLHLEPHAIELAAVVGPLIVDRARLLGAMPAPLVTRLVQGLDAYDLATEGAVSARPHEYGPTWFACSS